MNTKAIEDHVKKITESWTWNKLTEDERNRYAAEMSRNLTRNLFIGEYAIVTEIMDALYDMFLEGLGYSRVTWRAEE